MRRGLVLSCLAMNQLGQKIRSVIAQIRISLDGHDRDYTTGSLRLSVFLLAVPMILELCLESVFAVVDMYVVGRLPASTTAIATVGLTESVISLVYSIAIGLSTAATALVSRRTGEGDHRGASFAGGQSIGLGVLMSALISLLGGLFPADVLRLMGASDQVIQDGSAFTRVMFLGSGSIMALFLINGVFRGAGNAAMAMRSLWLASIINILLCPILVHGVGGFEGMGLVGAAWATTIGRSVGVFYQLYHLVAPGKHLRLLIRDFLPRWHTIKQVINLALPATVQFLIQSGSWIILAFIVSKVGGAEASAGYQLAIRNIVFFILPAWGLSNAAATLVGQHLGAKLPDRAAAAVYLTARYNAIFMAGVSILFVFFPHWIASWYHPTPAVEAVAVEALRIIGSGYIFYGIGMVLMQALNGSGDTRTPTWSNLIAFWLVQVPLACFLAFILGWTEIGAFVAVPAAELLVAILAWYSFQKGRWRTIDI